MITLEDLKKAPVFYKNCKSVRKRGGKICEDCPFRKIIEKLESHEKGI